MKFSITYVSGNRKLGKAYRRVYTDIQELCRRMEKALVQYSSLERIDLWLSDEPSTYFEVTRKNSEVLEMHCGFGESLSFSTQDDLEFLAEVTRKLDTVLREISPGQIEAL